MLESDFKIDVGSNAAAAFSLTTRRTEKIPTYNLCQRKSPDGSSLLTSVPARIGI